MHSPHAVQGEARRHDAWRTQKPEHRQQPPDFALGARLGCEYRHADVRGRRLECLSRTHSPDRVSGERALQRGSNLEVPAIHHVGRFFRFHRCDSGVTRRGAEPAVPGSRAPMVSLIISVWHDRRSCQFGAGANRPTVNFGVKIIENVVCRKAGIPVTGGIYF